MKRCFDIVDNRQIDEIWTDRIIVETFFVRWIQIWKVMSARFTWAGDRYYINPTFFRHSQTFMYISCLWKRSTVIHIRTTEKFFSQWVRIVLGKKHQIRLAVVVQVQIGISFKQHSLDYMTLRKVISQMVMQPAIPDNAFLKVSAEQPNWKKPQIC